MAPLTSPRRLLVVGGPTIFWKLDRRAVVETLAAMLEAAQNDGGSVLLTTSPRTPPALREELELMVHKSAAKSAVSRPGADPSYPSLLQIADSIHVTADSVSMISDAIWTGKPLALVPVSPSPGGGLMFGVHDLLSPGTRAYPQDLRFFWKALEEIGIGERLATSTIVTEDILSTVIERAHAILYGDRVY